MAKACAVSGRPWHIFLVPVVMTVFFVSVGHAQASPNTDSMLGYWKFDGNGTDSGGDGATASLAGATLPSFDTQVPATSFTNTNDIRFNGTNSFVTFAGQSGLRPTSALTVSFWLNFSAMPSGVQTIVGNHSASYPAQGFSVQADTSSLVFGVGDGANSASVTLPITEMPVTTWHLVTATWDGATVRLYLDGAVRSTSAAVLSTAVSYANTSFSAGYFNGRMDDLRLYKRALSAAEIADLAAGRHTAASWVGAADTDYELSENWDIAAVPDPYTRVTIGRSTIGNVSVPQPQLGASESLAGLDIKSGSSLNLKNHNLTLNDSGVFSNAGSFILDNAPTQSLTNFVNDTGSGTVVVNNSANMSSFVTGNTFYNLTLNGPANIDLAAALVVHGSLTVNGGTLNLMGSGTTIGGSMSLNGGIVNGGTAIVSVAGDWQRTGGVFNRGNGTVVLTGTQQTVSGSNTFYNLTKTVSAWDRIGFGAGDTQTVTGTLTLRGASDIDTLNLRSSVPGTRWKIDLQGQSDFAYLDVKDSDNVGTQPIDVADKTVVNNTGNNRWIFDHLAPAIAIDSFDWTTTDERKPISGIATEASSTVTSVEFQVDSVTGTWNVCAAEDGGFDSATERFTCTPSYDLGHATHVYYFRATDADGYVTSKDFVTATVKTEKKDDGDGSSHGGSSDSSPAAPVVTSPAVVSSPGVGSGEEKAVSSDAGGSVSSAALVETAQKAENLGQTTSDWQDRFFGGDTCSDQSLCGNLADPDADGLTNAQEYLLGTDPNDADTNNNGVKDSEEFQEGNNPVTGGRIRYESPKNSGKEDGRLEVDGVEAVGNDVGTLRFNGKALPDSYVTLYIYSDLPTILTVKADSNGNWSYTLDKELGNGDHQVYVGITDSDGKVIAKSQPLAFIKTAEAVTIVPSAQAATVSASEKSAGSYLIPTLVLSVAGFLIALTTIGLIIRKNRRKAEEADDPNIGTTV